MLSTLLWLAGKDGTREPIRGLLADFLSEKARSYVEPKRKGTPKGKPIGLSQKKYLASLLDLTSIPVTDQAKKLGVSYGVLRKWRTEKGFLEATATHREEFSAIFWNCIKEHVAKEKPLFDNLAKLSVAEYARCEIPNLPYEKDEFSDLPLYRGDTVDDLSPPFDAPIETLTEYQYMVVMEGLRILRMISGLPPRKQASVKRTIARTLQGITSILTKGKISQADRRHGITLLRVLESELEQLSVK